MAKLTKINPLILPLAGVLSTGIFVLDLFLPLGWVVWLLYLLPLFLTFLFSHRQYLIPLATVCTALIIVGFIHSSPGIPVEAAAFNRSMGMVVLWITALLLRQYKQAAEALQNAHDQLEHRVEERTSELRRTIDLLKREDAERMRAEEALRESRERFRAAFGSAAIGMALVSPDGRWLQVNRALCEIVGYLEQELLATTFQAITHPDDLEANLEYVRQMLSGEIRTYQMEKRYFHKLGRIVWIQLSVSLVRDVQGNPMYFISQIQDITERKRAEEALHESETRLHAILDNSPSLVFLKDTEGRYLLINQQFEKVFHRTRDEIIGKTDDEIFPPSQAGAFRANDRKALQAGVPLEFEEVAFHDDGPHTSIVFKFPLRAADGKTYAIGGIATDITERKRAEDALRESEKRFASFMNNTTLLAWMKDQDFRYVYINEPFERVHVVSRQAIRGKEDFDFLPPETAKELRANDEAIFRTGRASEIYETVPTHDGQVRYWWVYKFPFKDAAGRPFVGGMAFDITERKRAEEALRRSEEQLRLALEERERLSQDLHDNIIQTIYAIGMGLEECHHLIKEDPAVADKKLRQAIADLNVVIRDVRSYIIGTEPETTSAKQLRAQLTWLARTIKSAQLPRFRVRLNWLAVNRLTPEEAKHVFFIAREAMSNSLRHSRASTGVLSLQTNNGYVRLEVEDDGTGFDPQADEVQGHGLHNIASRAQKLGAHFQVVSKPGHGTRIIVDIPKESTHASAGD